MATTKSIKMRRSDVWVKLDGHEHIWKYFVNDRIIFSISRLGPGQCCNMDKGHDKADEICYIISGTVDMYFPDTNEVIELCAEDAILIGESEPHQIINTSEHEVLMVWCAAPGVGFSRKPE
mgnify:CR=1 FL=1